MDLVQLRTFLAVLEHQSFSRAAEALALSQSTVSFQIRQLEAQAGARLLDRRGRTVRATAAGRLLRRYATRLTALEREARAALRAEEAGETGRITIAASTIPAEFLLPRAIARFRRRHPGVAVDIEVSDSRRALAALLDEACDLAVVGAQVRDRRVAWTPVASDQIVLVGPEPNPFAPSGRLTPAELRRVPLILREEGSGTGHAVRALAGAALAPVRIGSSEGARRCVLAGLGLAFLSRRAVAEDLRDRRLGLVKVAGTPLPRQFFAARLRRIEATPAARALVQAIIEEFD